MPREIERVVMEMPVLELSTRPEKRAWHTCTLFQMNGSQETSPTSEAHPRQVPVLWRTMIIRDDQSQQSVAPTLDIFLESTLLSRRQHLPAFHPTRGFLFCPCAQESKLIDRVYEVRGDARLCRHLDDRFMSESE